MKILLTETQMSVIDEELGVPSNIIPLANKMYPAIVKDLGSLKKENFQKMDDGTKYGAQLSYRVKSNIGDMEIKKLTVIISAEFSDYVDGTELIGMGQYQDQNYDFETKKMKMAPYEGEIVLFLNYKIPNKFDFNKDIHMFQTIAIRERKNFISSLTHELHHSYSNYKEKYQRVARRATYATYSNIGSFGITPFSEFFYMLYFMNKVESFVRTSEISSQLKLNNVQKKTFKTYLTNNDVYKRILSYKYMTYDKFMDSLYANIKQIDKHLEYNGVSIDGLSDENKINKVINAIYRYIYNEKLKILEQIIFPENSSENEKAFIMYLHKQYLEKFYKNVSRYGDKPHEFFKREIMKANVEADRVLKKIGRLYGTLEV